MKTCPPGFREVTFFRTKANPERHDYSAELAGPGNDAETIMLEPLLASQEENEWPREDHTNPLAQPERTGIVRVH